MGDDARTPVEEPLWKRIILAVPRGFGSLVRSVAGVGEFDPVYRRDGLCFLLIVLAVFFCASEWFRVNGIIGRVLHAFSAGVLGVMSVVLPVLLVIVSYTAMATGLVAPPAGIALPFTTPIFISGYLATGGHISGTVLQVVNLAISLVVYYPFFRAWDRLKAKEEHASAQPQASAAIADADRA